MTAPAEGQVPAPLAAGPLDVVGDVHGELGALTALLGELGYGLDGSHPAGRRLVFVGDLCDRGPDSPGVIRLVAGLAAAGRAQCLLGNHELNILRGSAKTANGWFFEEDHDRAAGRFTDCAQATDAERASITAFFATLPLALERPDLRIVHAAWHPPSFAALSRQPPGHTVVGVYREYAAASEHWGRTSGVRAVAEAEYREWGRSLDQETVQVPLLAGIGRMDEQFQMSNPVRVPTSGVERVARAPFFASGKWRMVDRVPWWRHYADDVPVIFGHYWRWARPEALPPGAIGSRYLFGGIAANQWLGPHGTAFCVDFSVGARYRERQEKPAGPFQGRLAAVRWPERELVFDDGERLALRR